MISKVINSTGKRKNAVCKLRLISNGTGKITINDKTINEYFQNDFLVSNSEKPFSLTETINQFDVVADVLGGGLSAQSDALRHAIAQALAEYNEELRSILKSNKFLTRDSRVKERKKYGLKSARKAPQYSKR